MKRAHGNQPRKKRRLLKSIAALFAAGVLVIVALPLWLPWILPTLLNAFQAGYSDYERVGYSRLALHDFHFERRKIRIEAGRVELWTPTAWIWKRHADAGDPPSAQPFVSARDWRFEVLEKDLPPRPPPRPYDSTVEVLDRVDTLLPVIRDWLPSAQLTNGQFVVRSEVIEVPSVEMDRGNVRIALAHERLNQEARVVADLSGEAPHQIEVSFPGLDLVSSHRLTTSNQDWLLESAITWRTNQIHATNRFSGESWFPSSASLVATEFRLPGELSKTDAYYQDPRADLEVQWQSGTIEARLNASAEPLPSDLALPALSADVFVTGDTNALRLEAFAIRSPWIDAELSQPLVLLRSAPWIEGQARLDVSARLNELPLESLSGGVTGVIEIEPGQESDFPSVRALLTGTDIQSPAGLVEELRLAGRLVWPRLELDPSMAKLAGSVELRAGGAYNFATEDFDGVEWSIAGVPPGKFVPADLEIGEVKASGTIAGNLRRPAHTGEIEVAHVETSHAPPADLRLVWEGEGGQFRDLSVKAGAGKSSIDLSGELRIETSPAMRADLRLDRLIVELPDQVRYTLRNRLSAGWRLEPAEADDEGPGTWELSVDEFVLEGGERRFSARAQLSWPERGDVNLTWQGARLADFSDFITSPLGESRLDEFGLQAAWNNGPAELDLNARGTLIAGDARPLSINAQLIGDESGIHFEPLVIAGQEGEIASLRGSLPVRIVPGQPRDPVRLLEAGAMDLKLATRSNPAFWDRVAEISGVELENPEAEIVLRGRPDLPEGTIRFDASSLRWKPPRAQVDPPPLDNVHLLAVITPDELRVDEFSLTIQEQPVAASGQWPLSPDSWVRIRNRELPDWQEASAELNVDSAEIAAFTSYLPLLLAPQGSIDLDLRLESGSLDGRLELHDAATRPMPPVGPLRAIEARMRFSDQEAVIEGFQAELGGQPVRMDGTVKFAGIGLPEFDLTLKGGNIPLARQPGLVLRSDLDLRVARADGEPALISGALALRQSLFLQDISALKPGGLAEPSRRPPYFSVDQDPFSTWRLDLKITGQKFLRVRSPLFKGSISANLELRGTLEEPTALGEVRIEEGQIQFPFATLAVDQGTINLGSDNPYEPQLFITASGRNYSYEIRMEIEGSASEPSVVFSSNPPLNSEDIVLMLTAGEVPTSEFTFSNQQKASRLAMFFGRNLLTRLGADESTAERLTIRSGEHISETGKLTYHIEYELTDRWSLVGEYDRFNALNAGLKWRVYSK